MIDTSDGVGFMNALVVWDWPCWGGHDSFFDWVGDRVPEHVGEALGWHEGETIGDADCESLHWVISS